MDEGKRHNLVNYEHKEGKNGIVSIAEKGITKNEILI